MRVENYKILLIFAGLLYLADSMTFAEVFPAWMDEVEFRSSLSSEFRLNSPKAPIDPETGLSAPLEISKTSKKLKKPKLPDFSKMRKKAIKSTIEKRASDTLNLQYSIEFSEKNLDKLVKNRDDLIDLLKTVKNPFEKERLNQEKELLDKKINATITLLQLINSKKGNLAEQISHLTESEFNQAMQLQQVIFARPLQQKLLSPKPTTIKKQLPVRQFYKPTSRFKSFFIECKQKARKESELKY